MQQIEQTNAMLDAKAQELTTACSNKLSRARAKLQGADLIRADMQRIADGKQPHEAEVKAARDQLTNEVQKKEFDPGVESDGTGSA